MNDENRNRVKPTTKTERTKRCNECQKQLTKDQFANRQWKTTNDDRICRNCAAYAKYSDEKSRTCRDCKLRLPRTEYAIHQWSKKGEDNSSCISCVEGLSREVMCSIADPERQEKTCIERPDDGILVCAHSKELCDVCMVDYTLMNDFTRKRTEIGREDLTEEETNAVIKKNYKDSNFKIDKKICIMDGQAVCPRDGRKLRCPCNEVTYCSVACQKHHWMIHKMTCKWQAEKEEKKARKKQEKQLAAANGLTEEQKNFARMEAFFAENNGGKHSIEECAWQLGEHPLVIGGGSITYGRDGEEFIKGDVAKIYREKANVEWDGSPRFGMGPYEQKKPREDWIAKAKEGKSQKMKDIESELLGMYLK